MSRFRPLSRRDDESFDALHENVPPWLSATLADFITWRLTVMRQGVMVPNRPLLMKLERELESPLDWRIGEESALNDLFNRVTINGGFMLDVVDWCLMSLQGGEEARGAQVTVQLREAGSAWTVGVIDEEFRLMRRVDETITEAAKSVMSTAGRAGQHLKKGWEKAYGRHPDASGSYREAVRAVEAVGAPVISPRNPTATLGTMIADVRNAPTKWEVVLKPTTGDPVARLIEMMRLLWTSELDRHGTADESVPLHVSVEEAQAAVHMATTLVQLFQSGAIKAR
jgi:hypothetical protein